MRRYSLLCDFVHSLRPYLHLDPMTVRTHNCRVQSLVAIRLRRRNPVSQSIWMRTIEIRYRGIYHPRLRFLVDVILALVYYPDSHYVIYLLERHILGLHLVPYRIDRLYSLLHLILIALFVQSLFYRVDKTSEEIVSLLRARQQSILYIAVNLRILIFKSEFLEFRLYSKQSKPMSERRIQVQRLASDFQLFVLRHRRQRPHVMKTVRYLYHYHPNILGYSKKQFPEVLSLRRGMSTEHASRNLRESVNNLSDSLAEDILQILHRIVGILDHIVQQRRAYRSRAEPYLLDDNSRHSQRVKHIRLARTSSDASMRLVGELERLIHQVIIQIMTRISIILKQQVIVMLNHLSVRQFLLFCCYRRHIRFVIHSSYLFYITWISSSNII